MSKYDIVVMGDVNLDWSVRNRISFPFVELDSNGVIEWARLDEVPGGSGLNFAHFARNDGHQTLLLGKVGDDSAGRYLYEWLKKRDIATGVSFEKVTYLFSLDLHCADELDNCELSESLIDAFREHGWPLAHEATDAETENDVVRVEAYGQAWIITSCDSEYSIRYENQELNVYFMPSGTGRAFIARDSNDIRFLLNNRPNANSSLFASDVAKFADEIASSHVLYISGYCFMYPNAPRHKTTLSCIEYAQGSGSTSVVLDVVPHHIYRTCDFPQFRKLTEGVDILISEVSTMRRFLGLGKPDEHIDDVVATNTAKRLGEYYDRFILRFGKSGCDEQLIWLGSEQKLIRESTGHASASVSAKRSYGDRLALQAFRDHFKILPGIKACHE